MDEPSPEPPMQDPELRRLPTDLQESLHARLAPTERLWCLLDGGRAIIAATDGAAYLHDGRHGHPDWERLEWASIIDVAVATGDRTAVVVRRRGGRPVLFTARGDGAESFLQCATILNLLAIRGRRPQGSASGWLPTP
jgi:hypothetical protein